MVQKADQSGEGDEPEQVRIVEPMVLRMAAITAAESRVAMLQGWMRKLGAARHPCSRDR